VKIYASEFASGSWVCGGDHSTAPHRLWDYDTAFNKVSNLLPLHPERRAGPRRRLVGMSRT